MYSSLNILLKMISVIVLYIIKIKSLIIVYFERAYLENRATTISI